MGFNVDTFFFLNNLIILQLLSVTLISTIQPGKFSSCKLIIQFENVYWRYTLFFV